MCARYLSPDADEVLQSVDQNTVYVIGTPNNPVRDARHTHAVF